VQTTVGDIYGNKIYEWLVRKEPLSYVPLLITPAALPPGPKGPGFRAVYRMKEPELRRFKSNCHPERARRWSQNESQALIEEIFEMIMKQIEKVRPKPSKEPLESELNARGPDDEGWSAPLGVLCGNSSNRLIDLRK